MCGADRNVLLRLYHALVRSKLDYRSALSMDRPVGQFYGIWIRFTIKACVSRWGLSAHLRLSYTEAHEPSLTSRRLNLFLNYVLKLKSLPENPAYSCVFETENIKLFEESESKIPPLGILILPHLEKSKNNLNLTDDAPSLDIAPSMLSAPTVRFDPTKLKKNTTNPET